MTTTYNTQYTKCFPISDTNANILLAASTAIAYTVPGTPNMVYRMKVSCSSTADVWINQNGTATVPTTNTVTATRYQERIDLDYVRYVKGGDVLSFISTGTPQVGISLLQLPITP